MLNIQTILLARSEAADFTKVTRVLGVLSEDLQNKWKILRRLPADFASQEGLLNLALSEDKSDMFPTFSSATRKLLLRPIGTVTVARSFSTMNRILTSQR